MGLNAKEVRVYKVRPSQREDLVPDLWYNIVPDLPGNLDPPRAPDGSAVPKEAFHRLFAKELVKQEFSQERYVKIPGEVRETLIRLGRPTPHLRARNLENT